MGTLSGRYVVDLENSAKLAAGYFHARFVMKPGYDEAIAAYTRTHADALRALSIEVTAERLIVRSGDEEESFPVLALDDDEAADQPRLTVDWYGSRTTFEVASVGPGSVHFRNEGNELGSAIWRRSDDDAPASGR